jgi:hypothetical protein
MILKSKNKKIISGRSKEGEDLWKIKPNRAENRNKRNRGVKNND